MTEWQFTGDMTWWQGALLALFAAWLTWRVYRREANFSTRPKLVWSLSFVRALVVFIIVMLLTAPVMVHRKEIGELGRVYVFLDSSKSMGLTDEHMSPGRKLLIAHQRGWIKAEQFDTHWIDAANALTRAVDVANKLKTGGESDQKFFKAADEFINAINQADAAFQQLPPVKVTNAEPVKGSIIHERWNGSGNVSDLDQLASQNKPYNRDPDAVETLNEFDAPRNRGENYTARIRGYIYPPQTGEYTFWINSDDQSRLYLGTSDNAESKRVIARVDSHIPYGQWNNDAARSGKIQLQAGKRYYIQAVHVEGNGEDHLAVGWQMPDQTMQRPIEGKYLSSLNTKQITTDMRETIVSRFNNELKQPMTRLDRNDVKAIRQQLRQGAIVAANLEQQTRAGFDAYANALLQSEDQNLKSAVAKVDTLTRWERTAGILLDNERALLTDLADTHHVNLIALNQNEIVPLWRGEDATQPLDELAIAPDGAATNLAEPLKIQFQQAEKNAERVAAVLISDGRHNTGTSPLQVASILGNQNIPVMTVGLGMKNVAPDLAVLDVDTPESVFAEDRVNGTILINDTMPPGQAFVVRVQDGDKTVWERNLVSTSVGKREVGFNIPLKDMVQSKSNALDADVKVISMPLNMKVSIDPINGELKDTNNSAPFSVRAITQGRKLLVLDGRPRWEFRYIKNLFDRDRQWVTNYLVGNAGTGGGELADRWTRGSGDRQFPDSKNELFKYDLIVFGEIKPGTLTEEELEWVSEFVNNRGGGIIFIDGQRGYLSEYQDSPIGSLIPVKRNPGSSPIREAGYQLTAAGNRLASLKLTTSKTENPALWRKLPKPHYLPRVELQPGSELLATSTTAPSSDANAQSDSKDPVFVFRRVGAGRVFYSATDETWRWRYQVGDLYHARYWNQLATWMMERPYAVQDKFVSLDVGASNYVQGDRANLRVRLRDEDGKPITEATVQVELYKDGEKVASAMLKADQNLGGAFRGQTDVLSQPGEYEVGVNVTGFVTRDMKARTSFVVKPLPNKELNDHQADFELLQRMANASSGQFYPEERADELMDQLAPLSQGRIEITQTELWKSYWVFVPIMMLLGGEWYIRKRAGML